MKHEIANVPERSYFTSGSERKTSVVKTDEFFEYFFISLNLYCGEKNRK
jgi:hypothetical protein